MYHRLFYTFVKCYLDILCYCLTKRICKLSKNRIISKHLMLLFNKYASQTICERIVFQNISCYCLTYSSVLVWSFYFISKHLMLLFNLVARAILSEAKIFQNISCYCLTYDSDIDKSKNLQFQNISCYCLTISQENEMVLFQHFKTSHVIV